MHLGTFGTDYYFQVLLTLLVITDNPKGHARGATRTEKEKKNTVGVVNAIKLIIVTLLAILKDFSLKRDHWERHSDT